MRRTKKQKLKTRKRVINKKINNLVQNQPDSLEIAGFDESLVKKDLLKTILVSVVVIVILLLIYLIEKGILALPFLKGL